MDLLVRMNDPDFNRRESLLSSPRYFAHNFHPNTPSFSTQDMPVSTDHVGVSGTVHLA
jgi:hypothetical protein